MMLGEDGYPDEKSLNRIKDWDIFEQGLDGLFDLIYENTNWADRQIHKSGKRVIRFTYHTGGWSGNEDVIEALTNNPFWFFFWQKSLRGGHHYFKIEHPEWYGKGRLAGTKLKELTNKEVGDERFDSRN